MILSESASVATTYPVKFWFVLFNEISVVLRVTELIVGTLFKIVIADELTSLPKSW